MVLLGRIGYAKPGAKWMVVDRSLVNGGINDVIVRTKRTGEIMKNVVSFAASVNADKSFYTSCGDLGGDNLISATPGDNNTIK